jgi:PEP-CTERM motif-containing protein
MRTTHVLCIAMALMLVPTMALGDSITPGQTVNLVAGQSKTISKTITMDAASAGKLDVFFLVETTQSISSFLTAISDQAGSIVDQLGTSGFSDINFGVGRYSDFPDGTFGTLAVPAAGIMFDDVPYEQLLGFTPSTAAAKGALPLVAVDIPNGGDGPESSLYALHQVATTEAWRADAAKVVLWFGDSPGHDGLLEKDMGFSPDYPSMISQQNVIDTMTAYGIIVEGISIGGGLDAFAVSNSGYTYATGHGQGTAITTGTGGDMMELTGTSTGDFASQIVSAIFDAVTTGFLKYNMVDLDVSEGQFADLTTTYSPGAGYSNQTGWDRSSVETFDFNVTFTAAQSAGDGTYNFDIWGLIDGGKLLPEDDKVIIGRGTPDDPSVPEPSTMILMGLGLAGLGFAARRKLRK